MSYMALYREWRPKVFEDLIGQDYIVKTIRNQILENKVPHAYLFCGTRGTGKTSTAKILSRAVNCLHPKENGDPCNECEMCRQIMDGTLMDVIEIDAASNTGVDNIRDLIEDVKYPPQSAKRKVYIIDEVHMLSIQAFNALLKTIEEPPSYVIFILATTDPQKVPPTILSRCQRFDFKRIGTPDMVKRLRTITDSNGVLVDDKTLLLIARMSDGAMRDALSILDQSMSMQKGKIDYNDVVSMLGLTSNEDMVKLVDFMCEHKVEDAVKVIDKIILNGKDVVQFTRELSKHFRNLLMVKVSRRPEEIIDASEDMIETIKNQAKKLRSEEILRGINIFVDAENQAKTVSQPRLILEMAVIKFCKIEYDNSADAILVRLNSLEEKIKSGSIKVSNSPVAADEKSTKKEAQVPVKTSETNVVPAEKNAVVEVKTEPEVPETEAKVDADAVKSSWKDIIELIKSYKVTAASLLDLGNVIDISGNVVIVGFEKAFLSARPSLKHPRIKR